MNKRKQKLLRGMARDLQNGTPPFNERFLTKHQVTFDECLTMSEMAGNILAGYLMLPEEMQLAVITQSAFNDSERGKAQMVFTAFVRDYFSRVTIERLHELTMQIDEELAVTK